MINKALEIKKRKELVNKMLSMAAWFIIKMLKVNTLLEKKSVEILKAHTTSFLNFFPSSYKTV